MYQIKTRQIIQKTDKIIKVSTFSEGVWDESVSC